MGYYKNNRPNNLKKIYELDKNESFVNPYTFIGLPKEKKLFCASENDIRHTGFLDCEIITKTPLVIPDTSRKKQDKEKTDHFHYPFYRVGGSIQIPGSSIRGAIRSVYEVATDSCMVTVDGNEYLTKRLTSHEAYMPALLIKENNNWKFYHANRISLICKSEDEKSNKTGYKEFRRSGYRSFATGLSNGRKYVKDTNGEKVFHGDRVFFSKGLEYIKGNRTIWEETVADFFKADDNVTLETFNNKGKQCDSEGYLYIGELIGQKHAEGIFEKTKINNNIKNDKIAEELERLKKNTLKTYRNEKINRGYDKSRKNAWKHMGYSGFEPAEKNGVIPIWAKADGFILSLSPASIGRVTYQKSMEELMGEFKPCEDVTKLCKACTLFGTVTENDNSRCGMIRITDAKLADINSSSNDKLPEFTLKEMGTPKPSFEPFYSLKGEPLDSSEGGIRGRKFYWHNPIAAKKEEEYSTEDKSKRNGTYEVLKEGKFIFRIYYENITCEQLNELKWVVTLGENDKNGKQCHKLGYGKPLGLGSVKIVINRQVERKVDIGKDVCYQMDVSEEVSIDKNCCSLNEEAVDALLIVTDFTIMRNQNICYPYITYEENDIIKPLRDNDNRIAAHQCFSKYKNPNAGEKKTVLPEISEKPDEQILHPYRYKEEKHG